MAKARMIWNSECVKCDIVQREMVLAGAVVMCQSCFQSEFTTDDPVKLEREKYLEWMRKAHEKAEAEV